MTIAISHHPVIIIGAARSGTNMLRDALTWLPGVATWPCDEINYIWRHYSATSPNDELRPEQATPRVRRYVREAFQRLSHRRHAVWVVEKTCANSLRVDYVRAIFPEAKFLFIARDGRDVVASAVKRWRAPLDLNYTLKKARYVPLGDAPLYAMRFVTNRVHRRLSRERRLATWGPRFDGIDRMLTTCSIPEVCAEQWARSVTLATASLSKIPANQVHSLRYEDFVREPEQHVRQITEFLGIANRPGRFASLAKRISASNVEKWQRDIDANTLAAIDEPLERGLQALRAWDNRHQTAGRYKAAA